MRQDNVLDLFRADLFSSAVDQILLPTFNDVISRAVLPHQISRSVEAFRREYSRVIVWNSEVSAQGVGTPTAKFAHLPDGHVLSIVIQKAYLVVRRDGASHGLQTYVFRIVGPHKHQKSL